MAKVDTDTATAGSAVMTLGTQLREATDADHAFFVTVALCELLRRLKNPKPATQDVKKQAQSIIDFLTTLVNNDALDNWNKINFSLTQHLLGSTYDARLLSAGISHAEIPVAMTAALSLFVDRVIHSPETLELRVATIDDMAQSVEDVAGAVDEAPAEEPAAQRVEAPAAFDLYEHKPAYFQHPPITYELLRTINAEFVSYVTPTTTGEFGPPLLGLALEGPDGNLHTFFETGEYMCLKPGAIGLATHTDAQDIKSFPPSMLMYAVLAADLLHSNNMITNEQHSLLTGGSCGRVGSPDWRMSFNAASADDLDPVTAVLKASSQPSAFEAARPVTVNFQIDETKFVRVSGVYAKNGSYVTARLIEAVDGKEKVKLVHTVPRLFSACGVYAFPLVDENEFVSLVILN